MTRRTLAVLLTAAVLLVSSGCGDSTSPADDVPALATALDEVDAAVEAGDDEAAAEAVTTLSETATRAEESGDLDADAADEIVAAAEALLDELSAAGTPSPEPSTPTTSAPTDEETDETDEETAPPAPEEHGKPGKKPHGPKESKGKSKK